MSMLGLLVRVAGSQSLVQEGGTIEPMSRCPAPANEIVDVRQAREMHDFPTCVQAAAGGLSGTQARRRGS
jgi:hypothetical protein